MLRTLLAGHDLADDEAQWAMNALLDGQATDAQVAGFLTALRAKGESAAEVSTFVDRMLAHARLVSFEAIALDVVGTGGDHSHSVNISTMSALVCAAAGAVVIKHGNRAASSSTGTADVLEALGVRIDLEPDEVAESARRTGIGFCFAPQHHPAMRHVAAARRDLGIPTVFNLLGPLANPGRAAAALVGCADLERAPVMAEVLARRGVRALVVRGDDGWDEVSTATTTQVWDVTGAGIEHSVIDPTDLGIAPVDPQALIGGAPDRNAELLRLALGTADPGPDAHRIAAIRDVVALNAATAMVAYRAAEGRAAEGRAAEGRAGVGSVSDRIGAELEGVRAVLERGAAWDLLERWAAVTVDLVAGRPAK